MPSSLTRMQSSTSPLGASPYDIGAIKLMWHLSNVWCAKRIPIPSLEQPLAISRSICSSCESHLDLTYLNKTCGETVGFTGNVPREY